MDLAILKRPKTIKTKIGRPRVYAQPIMVRLRPEELDALDRWIEGHGGVLSRPLAIRALIREATSISGGKKR